MAGGLAGLVGLRAGLTVAAWRLRPVRARPAPGWLAPGRTAADRPQPRETGPPRAHRWFAALLTSYSLEGVGYIIAGTFLVAAINENSPAWAGSGAWVLAGLAALPASAMWAHLAALDPGRPADRGAPHPGRGIALPGLVSGVAPALLSAVLFGGTFLGVASMALALGAHLRYPRAVALLTTGYGLGQILGPLIVTPLLHHGYHVALLVGAVVVLASAPAAAVLRINFPHRVGGWSSRPGHRIGLGSEGRGGWLWQTKRS